ncbi:ribosomal protein L3 [Hamiltosporidium tvaerminnensis]|uniref:Ribosomal protein L3 n=3 Tax=Hamiltosporidium TaxID=1176354 RepID=A0A4Q9KVW2_9MICR|nr:60S ribosomal protein L3 [Hamiltosporidium tvaerminnensis]TBT99008.1 ribosomal protein L3 [Hamiltosporidium tvaerminnensis]TBU00451.1 ribosomal protein L3 [Hamiltosporidium magnivora]TBU10844.1 ribosomal protein L3 [Hamiltosporidium tvaerminnensis]
MSCRKFEAPRHGSLGFCPRRRAKNIRPPVSSFPTDTLSKKPHLTAFLAFKAGMSHVVRMTEKSVLKRSVATVTSSEVLDAVTYIESPPMVGFGLVGYKNTIYGLKRTGCVLSQHLSESVHRRMTRNFYRYRTSKNSHTLKNNPNNLSEEIQKIKENSDSIRILVHTQVEKIPNLKTKKANIAEIQINGGNIQEKVEFVLSKMEKEIKVEEVFETQESIDVIGVTKGKGFEGVTKRFGTRILPRKTRKGIRKVACIGAWHPAGVLSTVPRAGQMGFHRRTMTNLQVYMIGNGHKEFNTEYDLTVKGINPMGGFPHYGNINNDFVMVKGSIMGPRKRVVVLRKSLSKEKPKLENVILKFVDTSSKIGHGRFQTSGEKKEFYGILKKDVKAGGNE